MKRRHPLHPHTAVINRKQKIQSKTIRHHALEWLAQQFPEAFDNSKRIRPLKKGIMNDILECADEAATIGISRSKFREAVVIFTRRLDYLTCLKAQEMRIDLHGNPITPVNAEDAGQAANKIKKQIEKSLRNTHDQIPDKKSNQYISSPDRINNSKRNASFLTHSILDNETNQLSSFTAAIEQAQTNTAYQSKVIIKHKTTRTFDPNAVARLKEKLGLRIEKK